MEETQDIEVSPYQAGLDKAWQEYYDNNYDTAEATCLDLIAQYPEKSYCHYILGHVYRMRELYQKAADEFLIGAERDCNGSNHGFTYYWLGELYDKGSWSKDDTKYIYNAEKSEQYYNLARKAEALN